MSSDDMATQDLRVTIVDAPGDARVDVDDVPLVADLARYEELGLIAKGGMGEVRLYKDHRIARPLAVKVLLRTVKDDQDYRSRFMLEARLQGQLEHPSIVPVHDLGELPDGQLFFSMTRVKGRLCATHSRRSRTARQPSYRGAACSPRSRACASLSTSRTTAASCTATSSPRTSCSASTARPTCSTGASPR